MTKHDERAKERAHVAHLIERGTRWTVGWHANDETLAAMYDDTAKKIMRYLAERSKREGR